MQIRFQNKFRKCTKTFFRVHLCITYTNYFIHILTWISIGILEANSQATLKWCLFSYGIVKITLIRYKSENDTIQDIIYFIFQNHQIASNQFDVSFIWKYEISYIILAENNGLPTLRPINKMLIESQIKVFTKPYGRNIGNMLFGGIFKSRTNVRIYTGC